mmetsp:Transcript_26977/g.88579  ORF Transcript_26977/g.88579 Transcript_26977/m.88579 type:complete len:220 (-) Transcript_26977:276-935(-)
MRRHVVAEAASGVRAVPGEVPVVDTEAWVVHERREHGVAARDAIEDGQPGRRAHGVRVGRKLRALKQDGADRLGRARVFGNGVLCQADEVRHDGVDIDAVTIRDCLEARHVLAADDDEARVVRVHAALLLDELTHGLERLTVGGEERDLLVGGVGTYNGGQLAERRHEDGLAGDGPCEGLKVHEEAAVACDASHTLLVEPRDGVNETLLDVVRQLATLA